MSNEEIKTRGIFVYPLSEFQVKYLGSLFIRSDAPPPHNVMVHRIAVSEKVDLLIEFIQYGRLQTIVIAHNETVESFEKKHKNEWYKFWEQNQ